MFKRFIARKLKSLYLNFSGLAGPMSQFLNGTDEFSGLVLAKMALIDQSHSVLPLWSAKVQELRVVSGKMCAHAFTFYDQNQFFSAVQKDKRKAT